MAELPIPPFYDPRKLPWWIWATIILVGGSAVGYEGFSHNGIGGGIFGFILGAAFFCCWIGLAIAYWPLTIVLGILVSIIAFFWNVGVPKH